MPKVILREKAIQNLNNIWFYTFDEWSEDQADKYYATTKLACLNIGENPEIGRKYDRINKDVLGIKSGKHIIFHQIISKDEIEVVRILHERMDVKIRINE